MDVDEVPEDLPDIQPISIDDAEPPPVVASTTSSVVLGDDEPEEKENKPKKRKKDQHTMTDARKKALAKARAMRSLKHELAKKQKLESEKTIHDLTGVIADMRQQLEDLSSTQRLHFERQESTMTNLQPQQFAPPQINAPPIPPKIEKRGYMKITSQDISF